MLLIIKSTDRVADFGINCTPNGFITIVNCTAVQLLILQNETNQTGENIFAYNS